jgi:Domain of unknown function DUF29
MRPHSAADLYEDDFFAWTQLQAKELRRFARTRPNLPLDLAHIAEEIADLGTERRNAVHSWTARVIEHLLLLEHSQASEPRRGWIDEIVTLRRDIERRYEEARIDLARKLERYGEDNVAVRLRERCPYTLDQVLGDFWPDPQSERSA